jgi:signal transduction histidine kinase/CheY-like chemotaxis protein
VEARREEAGIDVPGGTAQGASFAGAVGGLDVLERRPAKTANHAAEIAAYNEIMGVLAVRPQDVLNRLVSVAMRLCGAQSAGISMLERRGAEEFFVWRALAGRWQRFLGGMVPRAASACGSVIESGQPALLQNAPFPHADESTPAAVEVLLVPFEVNGRAIGTVWVVSHEDACRFDSEDLRVVQSFARFASTASQFLLNEAGAQRSASQKEALYQLSDRLHRAADIAEVYEASLDAITSALRCSRASILLFDMQGRMQFVARRGLSESYVQAATGHSPWQPEEQNATPIAIDDAAAANLDPALQAAIAAEGIASLAFIPLVVHGRLLGKFMAYSSAPNAFGADELELGLMIARQLAFAVERQRAEDMLRQRADQLMIATDYLRRSQGELQAADRRKDEFLAMLAHELRNPLAPIANAAQILRRMKGNEAAQDQARSIIERQIRRLTRLVDDLLEVSRINSGRIQLQPTRVALEDTIQRAVETVGPLFAELGHEVVVVVPRAPVWVEADGARLEQVVVNLLNNAAKYTDEGGRIEVTLETTAVEAVLSVTDNGVGIPAEVLPQMFELFTQADHTLDRAKGGLGVGLSVVKRLVDMHGGTVVGESTVGAGSRFTVRLPLGSPPESVAAENAHASHGDVASLRRLKVLVVDDNVDAADSLAILLRNLGQDVLTAHDGESAIDATHAWRPDIVLLDIGLPKLSGYDVAARLRQSGSQVPLVAMTGYGQRSDRQRSKAAGFDEHIVKPATLAQIQDVLQSAAARLAAAPS